MGSPTPSTFGLWLIWPAVEGRVVRLSGWGRVKHDRSLPGLSHYNIGNHNTSRVKTATSPGFGAKLGTCVKSVEWCNLECRAPGAVVLITLVMLHTDNITGRHQPGSGQKIRR